MALALAQEDDAPVAIQKVEGGPRLVLPGPPGGEIVVLPDGIADAEFADRVRDIVARVLEAEFGRVDADDLQAVGAVLAPASG